jgi:hypothetical protein
MRPFKNRLPGMALWLLVIILILSACNYPGLRTATEPETELVFTSAAETVQAQLTLGVQPSATFSIPQLTSTTPPPVPTATIPVVTTAPPTATSPLPTASPTPPCDLVKFVADVTIPDNTELSPGATFIKTWRLRNAGSCTWTSAYTLVYEGDNIFNAPPSAPITAGSVPPGGTIDVSVTLTAPATAGTFRQNFKLANASGQHFALGNGTKPFWAQIKVVVPTGIVYDFITQAAAATWKSGSGDTFDTLLTFGGADDDPNGVAKIKDGAKLETGAVSGKILYTVPKHTTNGVIVGAFPPYQVQNGDRIRARVGFLAQPDGSCGAGNATFQVLYLEGATTSVLGSINKTCNGALQPIDINITSLAGHTVQIAFLVRSEGDFQDDWAIWNSPRIER